MSMKIVSLGLDLLYNHKEENYEQEEKTPVIIDGVVSDFEYACWLWICE